MPETPMTVGDLIEHLKRFDPDDFVMKECSDDYYSGVLEPTDLRHGEVALIGAHDWTEEKDEYGKPYSKPRVHHDPGGWRVPYDGAKSENEIARKPCLIIRVE